MSQSREYADAVIELARSGSDRALAAVLDARFRGREGAVAVELAGVTRAIFSPPLEIGEPDRNALLYRIDQRLRDGGDLAGRETLRQVLVELLMRGLNRGESQEYLGAVARLVGHSRVVELEEMSSLLHQQLYGFLETHLGRPFHRLIELEGEELELATLAIDVWLATMPIQPEWPQHHAQRIESLIDQSAGSLEQGMLALAPRLELLSLAYRGLIKVRPIAAGERLWRLCRLVAWKGKEHPVLRRRWFATCRHQGIVFAEHPVWRRAFLEGARRVPWPLVLGDPQQRELLRKVFGKLEMNEVLPPALGSWDGKELVEFDGYVSSDPSIDLLELSESIVSLQTISTIAMKHRSPDDSFFLAA